MLHPTALDTRESALASRNKPRENNCTPIFRSCNRSILQRVDTSVLKKLIKATFVPFFDGVPYHQPFYKHVLLLTKSMYTVIRLRLSCVVPLQIQTVRDTHQRPKRIECAKRVDILYDSVRSDKIQTDTSAFCTVRVESVHGLPREREAVKYLIRMTLGLPTRLKSTSVRSLASRLIFPSYLSD